MWRGCKLWSVGVNPVCVEGVYAGADWYKHRLAYAKATWSGLGKSGEEGWDKRVKTTKKKSSQQERAHGKWQETSPR